jgi:pSer/pThr/pTyr-binding forkhead associated (FHA) protein
MPRYVVKRGKGKLQLLNLTKGKVEVGGSDEMDLILPNVSVSRHHARFLNTENGFRAEDVGSQNGVRVNGEKLESESGLLTSAIAVEIVWEQNQHVIKKCGLIEKLLVNGL